jgi:hypothetical protein
VARAKANETLFPLPLNAPRSPLSGAILMGPIVPKARIASVRPSGSTLAQLFVGAASRMVSVPLKPAIKLESTPVMKPPIVDRGSKTQLPGLQLQVIGIRPHHSPFSALSELAGANLDLSWKALGRRWSEAPNDLRMIALAVPLVIGLIWFSTTPKAKDIEKGRLGSVAPSATGLLDDIVPKGMLTGMRENIQKRAAVELGDDFRQGLGDWSGKGDWARGWSYDAAGFIRPRQMALYTPSLALENYRFEFLGQIERKALTWVFRAADLKNYYAARLEVTRGGPLPTVELVRWAVINGRAGPRKAVPLPMQVYADTLFRVKVDVSGTDFVTTVQGQIVDVFSDDRIARGGVGFYSESSEDARLRWIEVSHQYDFLGRLCAYLVPYNVSNPNVRTTP